MIVTKFQQLCETFIWYTHVAIGFATIHIFRPFVPFCLVTWARFGFINLKRTTFRFFLKYIKIDILNNVKHDFNN